MCVCVCVCVCVFACVCIVDPQFAVKGIRAVRTHSFASKNASTILTCVDSPDASVTDLNASKMDAANGVPEGIWV